MPKQYFILCLCVGNFRPLCKKNRKFTVRENFLNYVVRKYIKRKHENSVKPRYLGPGGSQVKNFWGLDSGWVELSIEWCFKKIRHFDGFAVGRGTGASSVNTRPEQMVKSLEVMRCEGGTPLRLPTIFNSCHGK